MLFINYQYTHVRKFTHMSSSLIMNIIALNNVIDTVRRVWVAAPENRGQSRWSEIFLYNIQIGPGATSTGHQFFLTAISVPGA